MWEKLFLNTYIQILEKKNIFESIGWSKVEQGICVEQSVEILMADV